jgi:hypothetical protein
VIAQARRAAGQASGEAGPRSLAISVFWSVHGIPTPGENKGFHQLTLVAVRCGITPSSLRT